MNSSRIIFTGILLSMISAEASIIDPVVDFKSKTTIAINDKILKWQADINGDGHDETFLSLKSNNDDDAKNRNVPAWSVYLSSQNGYDVTPSAGIQDQEDPPDSLGVGGLADIDVDSCFIGQITELGKRGIVTMRIDNPREGESIGKIYAYTIEGDHLKRTELAQYIIVQGPHALFVKYLAEDKRTRVQLHEIDP